MWAKVEADSARENWLEATIVAFDEVVAASPTPMSGQLSRALGDWSESGERPIVTPIRYLQHVAR
jgi:hypothetical protein